MRLNYFLLSATVLVVACNSNPSTSSDVKKESPVVSKAKTSESVTRNKPEAAAPKAEPATTNGGALSSESDNTAKAKKGWSKTAKGAVVGGVVGAGTGAVVNKKNRAVGAVVGGAAGAGVGAIIGNELDKKDGRH
jgi:hypothetical protein